VPPSQPPQPLSLGPELPVATIAACASLTPADIRVGAHKPVGASLGNPFVIAEVGLSALERAAPDFPSFRQALEQTPALNGRLGLYLYAHAASGSVQARMFAPLGGTIEDPATGSAAGPLGALLLSLGSAADLRLDIHQGVVMGRPSLLRVVARRSGDGIRATIAGQCVPVLRGEAVL
jgi:trans-2,3-dihydro-3-hydroxyanthranilate isomerase